MEYIAKNIQNKKLSESKLGAVKKFVKKNTNTNTNIFNINRFKALVIHVPVKKRETNNF